MAFLLILIGWWLACLLLLWAWKRHLFHQTWHEPYFGEAAILIESDDWGPGEKFHAERLHGLLDCLSKHTDSTKRPAVLTADIVLALPDIKKIKLTTPPTYQRQFLDEASPKIYQAMKLGISAGTLVPQLHGLEHCNGEALTHLYSQQDPRVEKIFTDDNWRDWEELDSLLQGHYVDGSHLPSTPISSEKAEEIVTTATAAFEQLFGHPSLSTVAPCYLWNDNIETAWQAQGIRYIQTAGYRCTGRDQNGNYIQAPQLIRPGDKNASGQIHLVRNVMYEPVDGQNTPETAYEEALQCYRQALPIIISTHRYNFTRSEKEYNNSLSGLDKLLSTLGESLPQTRFLASPELGESLDNPTNPVINRFNKTAWPALTPMTGLSKISAFLYRLKYRHPKLVLLSLATGLILPAALIILLKNISPPGKGTDED